MKNAYLIAAASSGSGKTTITMGLLRQLRKQGCIVHPYKCGPDFIDTQYHHIACGEPSYNIDPWMELGQDKALFERPGLHIIEGAMGLFDGADGRKGSAADIALQLGVPIILVINAQSMAHSMAPLLYGYLHYDPRLQYAGVIFNKVGSQRHLAMLTRAAQEVGIPVLGYLTKQQDLYSPSRHLGLDLSERTRIDQLAENVACQLQCLIPNIQYPLPTEGINPTPAKGITPTPAKEKIIYIAHDDCFSFLYQETIDQFRQLGHVHFFSPLQDEPVPTEADIVYLPGGYPEFFLPQLSNSQSTIASLRHTKARIFAECGGMMYISQSIDHAKMAGLLPISTTMQDARLHLGYRQATLADGTALHGHEFHYSSEVAQSLTSNLIQYDAQGNRTGTALFIYNNVIAGYTHWSPLSIIKLLHLC